MFEHKGGSSWHSDSLHFIWRLYWSDGLAQAGRIPPYDTDRALIVSVAAVDDRILTTPTAALIAKLVNAVSENPVAVVDTDGVNQPVRAAVGAHQGGDFPGSSTIRPQSAA